MEQLLLGRIWRESEFVTVEGHSRNGTCTLNALACAESWARQTYVATADVVKRAIDAGRVTDPSGAETLQQCFAQAQADGVKPQAIRWYQGDVWPEWYATLQPLAGHVALVMQVSFGQALVDSLSGKSENAVNLHYHAIAVVGYHSGGVSAHAGRDLPEGFWCADGDNYVVGDVLEFYPRTVLDAAHPCSAFSVASLVPVGASPMLPANFTAAGWSDDGTLTTGPAAPDGTRYVIRGLMRTRILALIPSGVVRPDDFPMELEHQDVSADRYVQTCNLTRWILQHHPEHAGTDQEWELFMSNLGASVLFVEKALAAATTQLTHITAANDALQQQIADQDTSNKALLSEKDAIIANLTTQLQNTPLPAAVQAKVNALDALKAALAA